MVSHLAKDLSWPYCLVPWLCICPVYHCQHDDNSGIDSTNWNRFCHWNRFQISLGSNVKWTGTGTPAFQKMLKIWFRNRFRCRNLNISTVQRSVSSDRVSCTLVGNPTPVRGILEKILPEVLQNLPEAVGRGQILEGRGQDFFQQSRGIRGWISS